MDFEEIHPSIIVYKNSVDDIDSLLDKIKYSENNSHGEFILEEWSQWFVFGTYTNILTGVKYADYDDIVEKNPDNPVALAEREIVEVISNATKNCIDHYVDLKKVNIPDNHIITSPNIAKYIRAEWLDDTRDSRWGGLAMQFHTDYEIGKWFLESRQFLLTANLYINDDYEGGEIIFYHDDSIIPYKPVKGDLIVFPSGSPLYPEFPNRNPYFHAVGLVSGGEKYFTRSYIQYETDYKDYYYELKAESKNEEELQEKIEQIIKAGFNTVGVFTGDGPHQGEAVTLDLHNWKHGENFWVSAHEILNLLYDIKYDRIFFRNYNGNNFNL
jgi:hypothetical protein